MKKKSRYSDPDVDILFPELSDTLIMSGEGPDNEDETQEGVIVLPTIPLP